ncbi:MAG: DivIVA domain-containing protein [Oscillospiraceae bacterium]|jgi:cell division initiation protein|nr:DivIVA domain-containing protein [Oscillospiraceae bacterium]
MLTPEQIKSHNFRSAGKGLYRSDDVDAFLREAAADYKKLTESAAQLQTEKDEMYERVVDLANAINQMRGERDLIQKTMIVAQRAADDLTARAKEDSARQLREAQTEAEALRRESRTEAAALLSGAKEDAEKLLLESQAHAENLQTRAKAHAENLLARAKACAEAQFDEARVKAQQTLVRVSSEAQREQQVLDRLKRETAAYREKLLQAVAWLPEAEEEDAAQAQEPEDTSQVADPPTAFVLTQEPEPDSVVAREPEEDAQSTPLPDETPDLFAALEAALEQPATAQAEEGFSFI